MIIKFIQILQILFFISLSHAYAYEKNADATITIGETKIIGTVIQNSDGEKLLAWFGVPFAQPPVGDLRWKAPRNIEITGNELDASSLPNHCVQVSNFYDEIDGIESNSIIGSEDCLYLNIFIPEKAMNLNKKLPVMFWIHGGGNTWGYSASKLFTDGNFAFEHDFVLVTTNYRLGPFGWFHYENLNENSSEPLDKTVNFGTLDTIKSLEWVNENIKAFNGDPNNITIFGESAGGRNVMTLMTTSLSKDLFQRGIAQSGYLGSDSLEFAKNDPRSGSDGFITNRIKMKFPNLSDDEIKQFMDDKNKTINFIRNLSAEDIISYYRMRNDASELIDVPNVIPDGVVIPEKGIYGAFRDGEVHDKEMIFGSTRDEDKLFMFMNDYFVNKPLKFLSWLWPGFDMYVQPKDPKFYDLYAKYMAESWKYGAVDLPSKFMSSTKDSNIYAYRFDWDEQPTEFGVPLSKLMGAAHAMEIGFIFKSAGLTGESDDYIISAIYDPEKRDTDIKLADEIGEYWVNFAYDGNPNENPYSKDVEWLNWDAKSDEERFIVLDSVNDKGIAMYNATLSADSILQGLASEALTVDQKCATIGQMFNRTTLTEKEVDDIYLAFLNGKCLH
tara:strand:+ start:258 stop:2096 length:1839 start_codon:yes stop_codon:yes gene_type:complete